jgi:hypothetical protein
MPLQQIDVVAPIEMPDAREFNRAAAVVTDLYLVCLGKYASGTVAKVLIEASDDDHSSDLGEALRVVMTERPFDYKAYWAAEKAQRRRLIFDFVHSEMMRLAEIRSWDRSQLIEAADCALGLGLQNVQLWSKPVCSPNRRRKAQLEVEYDEDSIRATVTISDRTGEETARVPLFNRTSPMFVITSEVSGRLFWEESDVVVLRSRDGRKAWRARVPTSDPL